MRKSIAIAAMLLTLCMIAWGCGGEVAEKTKITGVNEIVNLSVSDDDYDFMQGVSAARGDESVSVTADSSGVKFGNVGEYTVTYTADDQSASTLVRIYGEPALAVSGTVDVSYAEAYSGTLSAERKIIKDSFGQPLEVKISGLEQDDLDRISYGEHEVNAVAIDCVGNKKESSIVINITEEGKPAVGNLSVDISELTVSFYLGESEVLHFLNGGEEIPPDGYFLRNGYAMIEEQYLRSIGAGEYSMEMVLSSGWGGFTLTVTNKYSAENYGSNRDATKLNFGLGENLLSEEYEYLWSSTDGFKITATEYTDEYTNLHRDTNATARYYLNVEYFKSLLRHGYNILVMNLMSYTKVSGATIEYSIGGGTPIKMGWMGDEYQFVLNNDYVFDFRLLTEEQINNITSVGIYLSGYETSTNADWKFKYAKFRKAADASLYNGENLLTEEFSSVWKSDFVTVNYNSEISSGRKGTLWESENNAPTVIYLDDLFVKEIIERGYTEFHVRVNAYSPSMHFKLEIAQQYIFIPGSGTVGNGNDLNYSVTLDTDYVVDMTQINTSIISANSNSHFAVYPIDGTTGGWFVQFEDISFRKPS